MTRLRRQDGFSLVEMLLVCVVSLIVLGATMTAFTSFYGQNRSAESQSDNLDGVRVVLDREARQLRNLANPTYNATATIARATDYDFIFQTSDPAKTWVRYCLDTTGAGASASAGRLYMSESPTSTLSGGMTGACPGSGWTSTVAGKQVGRQQVVAEHVTNQANGLDRNLFGYACLPGSPAGCPAGTGDYSKITSVTTHVWVDANPRDRVKETDASTAVFLRNQNEPPTAAVTGPNTLGPHKVSLNATGSSDPEGRTLDYFWFMDSAPTTADLSDCTQTPAASIWEGPMLIKDFGVGATGTHNLWLVVRDPGCLTSTYGPVAVTVPS